jgi:gas vesicle protein
MFGFWSGFLAGVLVGGVIGVLIMAAMFIAKDADARMEREE